MSNSITNITDQDFKTQVLQSELPVLVDFWAPWCGPCKMIAPALEAAADKYGGRLKICKMNVDDNAETPLQYNVRGIPALILFRGGDLEAQKIGALSQKQLEEFIDTSLDGS